MEDEDDEDAIATEYSDEDSVDEDLETNLPNAL